MRSERNQYCIELTIFTIDDIIANKRFVYERYALTMYYAYLQDPTKALALYKATVSKLIYSNIYGPIPIDIVTIEEDDYLQELSLSKLPVVKSFIDDQIIPQLEYDLKNGPDQSMLQIWGQKSLEFHSFLEDQTGTFLEYILHYQSDDFGKYTVSDILDVFEHLSLFFEEAMNLNTNYISDVIK